jgi:lipoprotein Spr
VRSKKITHVGVYLANNYFVHASTTQGVMISNLNEDYWRKYFAGAGRVN